MTLRIEILVAAVTLAGAVHDQAALTLYVTLCLRLVYVTGLVYILVLLNRVVWKILKGCTYEIPQMQYIRRIGHLLLLAPCRMLFFGLLYILFGGDSAGMGITMAFDGIANYWPFDVPGLVVLAIAEIYKVGISYRQELDLTV